MNIRCEALKCYGHLHVCAHHGLPPIISVQWQAVDAFIM